jgi:hypothetical protein
MFNEHAVGDTYDVCRDPTSRQSDVGKSAVVDDIVVVSKD